MSPRVPIFLSAPGHRASEAYRVAVAELPLTVELAASPVGAVVVVDGRAPGGWSAEVAAALARGASGVVVDGVGVVDVPDADDVLMRAAGGGGRGGVGARVVEGAVSERGAAGVAGLPVSIVRRFQPRELIAAARDAVTAQGSRPHIVTVEAAGAVSTGVLRDALGWARELASAGGRELKPRSGSVLLESPDGVPVVVTWLGVAQVPWLRVCALGVVEVEVEVDEGTGCASVVTRSGAGEHVVRAGFEEPARRELRRAIDAARASVWPDELTPFLADLRLQASIVAPAGASTTTHAPDTDSL